MNRYQRTELLIDFQKFFFEKILKRHKELVPAHRIFVL